jgi:hypothetical protein
MMIGILAASAVAASAQLTPVPLWQGLRAGLTIDEVKRLVPSAAPITGQSDFLLYDVRVRAALTNDSWSMRGIHVRTSFYFADGKLAAMVASFPRPSDQFWSRSTVSEVVRDLTKAYGPADSYEAKRLTNCTMPSGRWVRTPTTVTLAGMRCSTKSDESGTLSVGFIPTSLFRRYVEENHLQPLPPDAYRAR